MFASVLSGIKNYLYHKSTVVLIFIGILGALAVSDFYIEPSHDSAWILYDAKSLINSVETRESRSNPFFINTAMHLLPAYLSIEKGWSLLFAFKLYCIVLMLFILMIYYAQIRLITGSQRATLLFLTAILPLLFLPLNDFGQRDHWVLCFLLPYIFSTISSQLHVDASKSIRLISGVLAAIAILMKPHYAIVLVAIEIYLMMVNRSLLQVFRIEPFVAFLLVVINMLMTLLVMPDAFSIVLPTMMNFYWAYSMPFLQRILPLHILLLVCVALSFLIHLPDKAKCVQQIAIVCILSVYTGFLLLGNTWGYRQLPFLGMVWVYLATGIIYGLWGRISLTVRLPSKLPVIINVIIFLMMSKFVFIDKQFIKDIISWTEGTDPEFSMRLYGNMVEEMAFSDLPQVKSIFVMDAALYPHTLFMVEHNLLWVSRYHSLWLLPAWARVESGNKILDEKQEKSMKRSIDIFHKDIQEDLIANKPDAFVVDISTNKLFFDGVKFDYIQHFYQYIPYFREISPEYTFYRSFKVEISPEREMAIYIRKSLL